MIDYTHYGGFIVPADQFQNVNGVSFENGWIISNKDYIPWYITKCPAKPEYPLESEINAFVSEMVIPSNSPPSMIIDNNIVYN